MRKPKRCYPFFGRVYGREKPSTRNDLQLLEMPKQFVPPELLQAVNQSAVMSCRLCLICDDVAQMNSFLLELNQALNRQLAGQPNLTAFVGLKRIGLSSLQKFRQQYDAADEDARAGCLKQCQFGSQDIVIAIGDETRKFFNALQEQSLLRHVGGEAGLTLDDLLGRAKMLRLVNSLVPDGNRWAICDTVAQEICKNLTS